MQRKINTTIDTAVLPEALRMELYDFYRFLVAKTRTKKTNGARSCGTNKIVPRMVKRFTPLTRDELYVR